MNMAGVWYPVIDYMLCEECGACINKCGHGAYDKTKFPSPVVTDPEVCVDHCHGCGNLCPQGAITYIGEDTGWTPPNGRPVADACGCGSNFEKTVLTEYLYLDLQSCDRCIGTDKVLDEVMATVTPALECAGYTVRYNKIEIETEELAREFELLSSPTIRVNGRDVCLSVKENDCGCCSDISATAVACRVFEYNGETYEVPPKEMLADAILKAMFGQNERGCSCGGYELPDNLKQFFDGKESKRCNCGGNCC